MIKCTVPMDFKKDKNGNVVGYELCGEEASYKVGDWYVCENHKKYYTDPHKWPATLLKGENNG